MGLAGIGFKTGRALTKARFGGPYGRYIGALASKLQVAGNEMSYMQKAYPPKAFRTAVLRRQGTIPDMPGVWSR